MDKYTQGNQSKDDKFRHLATLTKFSASQHRTADSLAP